MDTWTDSDCILQFVVIEYSVIIMHYPCTWCHPFPPPVFDHLIQRGKAWEIWSHVVTSHRQRVDTPWPEEPTSKLFTMSLQPIEHCMPSNWTWANLTPDRLSIFDYLYAFNSTVTMYVPSKVILHKLLSLEWMPSDTLLSTIIGIIQLSSSYHSFQIFSFKMCSYVMCPCVHMGEEYLLCVNPFFRDSIWLHYLLSYLWY